MFRLSRWIQYTISNLTTQRPSTHARDAGVSMSHLSAESSDLDGFIHSFELYARSTGHAVPLWSLWLSNIDVWRHGASYSTGKREQAAGLDSICRSVQMHKGTQYFFCPYCFQSVLLPSISYTNILNSTPAFRHVILHFDRIENSNKQQRRIESLFKYCNRCVLHVKSLPEHYQFHHSLNSNSTEGENDIVELKRNNHRSMNDHSQCIGNSWKRSSLFLLVYQHRPYPQKFDRSKPLPMATIRRRPTISTHYDEVRSLKCISAG